MDADHTVVTITVMIDYRVIAIMIMIMIMTFMHYVVVMVSAIVVFVFAHDDPIVMVSIAFTAGMLSAVNAMMLDVLAAVARKDYEDRHRQVQGQAKAKTEGIVSGRFRALLRYLENRKAGKWEEATSLKTVEL